MIDAGLDVLKVLTKLQKTKQKRRPRAVHGQHNRLDAAAGLVTRGSTRRKKRTTLVIPTPLFPSTLSTRLPCYARTPQPPQNFDTARPAGAPTCFTTPKTRTREQEEA
ncbi:unnamed protein product [Amoebophrya sp. A120]|nr:unnamed protein product [Amoebophrya sp. A120]|eukprot:GSA120T00016475001.1